MKRSAANAARVREVPADRFSSGRNAIRFFIETISHPQLAYQTATGPLLDGVAVNRPGRRDFGDGPAVYERLFGALEDEAANVADVLPVSLVYTNVTDVHGSSRSMGVENGLPHPSFDGLAV